MAGDIAATATTGTSAFGISSGGAISIGSIASTGSITATVGTSGAYCMSAASNVTITGEMAGDIAPWPRPRAARTPTEYIRAARSTSAPSRAQAASRPQPGRTTLWPARLRRCDHRRGNGRNHHGTATSESTPAGYILDRRAQHRLHREHCQHHGHAGTYDAYGLYDQPA